MLNQTLSHESKKKLFQTREGHDCQTNYPHQYLRKCIRNSKEIEDIDVGM